MSAFLLTETRSTKNVWKDAQCFSFFNAWGAFGLRALMGRLIANVYFSFGQDKGFQKTPKLLQLWAMTHTVPRRSEIILVPLGSLTSLRGRSAYMDFVETLPPRQGSRDIAISLRATMAVATANIRQNTRKSGGQASCFFRRNIDF